MKNEQLAAQAQLAADILRTGHPWEYKLTDSIGWQTALDISSPIYMIQCENEIRLVLATPGDGRKVHNHDSLSADQVGAGYRLIEADTEKESPQNPIAEFWDNGQWFQIGLVSKRYNDTDTYRLLLSTPWPEAKVEPRVVPLVAWDVLPGSAFRFKEAQANWVTPLCICDGAVGFVDAEIGGVMKIGFYDLMEIAEINKSIPITGKWDADAWEACQKEG